MKEELLINKQCFDEYIMVLPGSDYGRIMWQDIGLLNNATILEKPIATSKKLITLLHHAHFSFAINNHVQLPFQSIWGKVYSIRQREFDVNKKYCIIYTDVSAGRTDIKFLKILYEMQNVTLVLAIVNTMDRKRKVIESRLPYFHQIYSFDKKDAEQYGFMYYPTFYSRVDREKVKLENDAFFVGVAKGRIDILHSIYEKMTAFGVDVQFYISQVKKADKKNDGIHYNQWLNYSDVLTQVLKTNCIVEVMGGTQEGVTLRTMEAVCYNKRLLTNNHAVKELPFYDDRFIFVFDSVDDINCSFIKDKTPVDYKYNDEFSPIHLVDRINHEKMRMR